MKSNLINSIFFKSFIFSLLICFGFFFQYGYVNNDAFYYLDGAFKIENNLISNIPNYSYLIFFISKFFYIDHYQTGLLINFISLNFIYIFLINIKKIISYKKNLIDDYLILLFLFTGSFFSYFYMIIRDNIYSSLFLLSILLFFNYLKNNKKIFLYFSILSLLFASLFRFEALFFIFIYLLPQKTFTLNFWKSLLNLSLKLKMILIIIFVTLILSIHFLLDFFYISNKVNRDFLNLDKLNFAIILLSLITLFFKLIKSIGFVQFYFIFCNLRDNFSNHYFKIIILLVALNLFTCFYWSLTTNVITTRYLYISSLLLIVLIVDPLKSFFSKRRLIYMFLLIIYVSFFLFKNVSNSFNKLNLSKYIENMNLISYEVLDRNINFYRFFSLDSYSIDKFCSDNLPNSNYIILKFADYHRCNSKIIKLKYDYNVINDDVLKKRNYILLKKKF